MITAVTLPALHAESARRHHGDRIRFKTHLENIHSEVFIMNSIFSRAGFLVVALLTGCGGGGEGTSPSSPTPTPAPLPTCSNGAVNFPTCTPPASTQWTPIVLTVPSPTYTGENLSAFDLMNRMRHAAGSGKLAQNAQLDKAASNHMSYLFSNLAEIRAVGYHAEVVGRIGFTGVSPQDRLAAVGYMGTGSEVVVNMLLRAGTGDKCVRLLIDNSVYHRLSVLGGWTDVGVSLATDSAGETMCVIAFANRSGLSAGQIPVAPVTYPYANQTGLDTTFVPASETVNPAPDLGDAAIGLPITVSLVTQELVGANLVGFKASDVTVNAFTLTAQGGVSPVAARILTMAGVVPGPGVTLMNDPSKTHLEASSIVLLPLVRLAPKTAYTAVFKATVKGKAIDLAWSFTTKE